MQKLLFLCVSFLVVGCSLPSDPTLTKKPKKHPTLKMDIVDKDADESRTEISTLQEDSDGEIIVQESQDLNVTQQAIVQEDKAVEEKALEEEKEPKKDSGYRKIKREYFTGGKIRQEFIMTDKSGRNGLIKKYGYDGRVTSMTQIHDGMKNGLEGLYDKNGRILRKTPYSHGKKEGVAKLFYPDGKTMMEVTYAQDIKNGPAVKYNADGSVNERVMFKNGTIDTQYQFSDETHSTEGLPPLPKVPYGSLTN